MSCAPTASAHLPWPTAPTRERLRTLQLNLGRFCNLACTHCHVEAGPKRTEMISPATRERVIAWIQCHRPEAVDLTGGASKVIPGFRELVLAARATDAEVIDRCNLAVLQKPGQEDLAGFLAEQRVHVVASMPGYLAENVDKQRGRASRRTSRVVALLLAASGRAASALVVATQAVLVKPFAVVVLPALLTRAGWRRWWLVPATAALLYLPFAAAGMGLFASLLTFGGTMHYHGALDPLVRSLARLVLASDQVEPAVPVVLIAALVGGLAWLWLRRGAAATPTLAVRLLTVLLLCLPTLHPWYLTVVAVLLPFARSWALAVWTASVGVYWLHGIEMLAVGEWIETWWVTTLAHLPAIALMVFEVFGPPREAREAREPGKLPFPVGSAHA